MFNTVARSLARVARPAARMNRMTKARMMPVRNFEPFMSKFVGDGGKADEIPEATEGTSGKMHEEFAMHDAGEKRYEDEAIFGPFGTVKEPAVILSAYDSRLVGCVGGGPEGEHDLLWLNLQGGRLHACSECGQIFKLHTEPDSDDEDDH